MLADTFTLIPSGEPFANSVRHSWACRQACSSTHQLKVREHAGILDHRQEAFRRQQALFRMQPAQQGLEGDDTLFRQRDDRLVIDDELTARKGTPQVRLHVETRNRRLVHGGVEDHGVLGLRALGPVHGQIRVAQQFVG